MKATVLVIDGGGRGHVLVQKYLESPHIKKVFAIPGNDLMLENNGIRVKIFQSVKTTDIKKIKLICQKEKVDLVDVAQDDAVAAGLTDTLQKNGFIITFLKTVDMQLGKVLPSPKLRRAGRRV